MEGQPKLSAHAIQTLRAQNRARYSVVADESAVPPVEVTQTFPIVEEPARPALSPRKRELL